jgi:hypothetical protein
VGATKGGWNLVLGSLAAIIVGVGVLTLVLALVHQPSSNNSPASAGRAGGGISPGAPGLPVARTTSTVPTSLPADSLPPTSPPPNGSSTTTATTVAATSPGVPGQLVINTAMVDFGRTETTRAFTIGNSGNSPIQFAATGSSYLAVTPAGGSIPPAGATTLTVVFDRAHAPTGRFSGTVTLTTDAGGTTIPATAEVAGVSITGAALSTQVCGGRDVKATFTATINGPVQIQAAALTWIDNGGGKTHTQPMSSSDGTNWSVTFPIPKGIDVTWSITAVDSAGRKASTPPAQDRIVDCPTGG